MLMELVVGVQALGDSSRTWMRGDKQGGTDRHARQSPLP
jgi:hypothetical protein